MKADKYLFDGARTCDLRALSCDSKRMQRTKAKFWPKLRDAAKDGRIGG